MKTPSASLQAEWAAKLRASGFQDLESKGGLLSNRGNPTAQDDGKHMTTEARAEAEAYYDDAREALRTWHFRTRRDRDVWRLHVDRLNDVDIARHLGTSQRQVRQSRLRTIAAMREEARADGNLGNPGKASMREKVDRLVKKMDVEMLVKLAGVFA
jgi:hypothetical protein